MKVVTNGQRFQERAADGGFLRHPLGGEKLSGSVTVRLHERHLTALNRMASRDGKSAGEIIRNLLLPALTPFL